MGSTSARWDGGASRLYLLFTAVGVQIAFALDATVGVPIAPATMVWILAAGFPIGASSSATAWRSRRGCCSCGRCRPRTARLASGSASGVRS